MNLRPSPIVMLSLLPAPRNIRRRTYRKQQAILCLAIWSLVGLGVWVLVK